MEPVGVHNGGGVCGQPLPLLRRPEYGRDAGRRTVDRRGRVTGPTLGMAVVVGEGHPHLQLLARVGGCDRIGRTGRVGDVHLRAAVHPNPLVGVIHVRQAIRIPNVAGIGGEGLEHLRRTLDPGFPRGWTVDLRGRVTGQRLGMVIVVGEVHPHLQLFARIGGSGSIGLAGRPRNGCLRHVVHPNPLVDVIHVCQAIRVPDVAGIGGEGLVDLCHATDRRVSRGRTVVGATPTDTGQLAQGYLIHLLRAGVKSIANM